MAIVTISTRNVKCKDCDNCRYYYNGKRKLHKCILKGYDTRLNDIACACVRDDAFVWNPTGVPKRL